MLLLAPTNDDETCWNYWLLHRMSSENVLYVTFAQSACEQLQVWDRYATADPAQRAIISMGEFTRSTASNSATSAPVSLFSITTIEDPTNLAKLGTQISEQLDD